MHSSWKSNTMNYYLESQIQTVYYKRNVVTPPAYNAYLSLSFIIPLSLSSPFFIHYLILRICSCTRFHGQSLILFPPMSHADHYVTRSLLRLQIHWASGFVPSSHPCTSINYCGQLEHSLWWEHLDSNKQVKHVCLYFEVWRWWWYGARSQGMHASTILWTAK